MFYLVLTVNSNYVPLCSPTIGVPPLCDVPTVYILALLLHTLCVLHTN